MVTTLALVCTVLMALTGISDAFPLPTSTTFTTTPTLALGTAATTAIITTTAVPAITAQSELSVRIWPMSAQSGRMALAKKEDTNAQRMARGEPLKQPVRKDKLKARFEVAPSQAATTNSETYNYVSCAAGGFDYYGSSTVVTGSSDQELVDACANQAETDGETSFAIESAGGHCYTGVEGYGAMEESCASDNYAVYSQ